MQLLLDAGFDINQFAFSGCDSGLMVAVKKSDVKLVKFLIDAGLDPAQNPYSIGDRQESALLTAVKNGDVEMARLLLKHGVDPHDNEALAEAVGGNFEMSELLLRSHRARYHLGRPGFGAQALIKLIRSADFWHFAWLLENGLRLKEVIKSSVRLPDLLLGQTESPYQATIRKAHEGDARFLEKVLKLGCSPETMVEVSDDCLGRRATAFLIAVATGNLLVVKLFLKHNADVNFPARIGLRRTPLQQAAEKGFCDVVQLLIDSGADVNAPAAERAGGTALQLAAIGGYNNIIILLLSYGADVNAPTSKIHGRSALEGAAEHGRLDTVKLLLNAGAARDGEDTAQVKRAIGYANKNGFPYIGDMLQEYLLERAQGDQPGFIMADPSDEFFDWNRWDEMTVDSS